MATLPKLRYKRPRIPELHEYWMKRKDEYPYHILALTGKPAPHKHMKGVDEFISIPVGDGTSLWGFKSDVDAALFFQRYGIKE